LQDWSFFWTWDSRASTVRWMTSFATTEDDVSRFVAGVRHVTDSPIGAYRS
jgi:threonine aldolase